MMRSRSGAPPAGPLSTSATPALFALAQATPGEIIGYIEAEHAIIGIESILDSSRNTVIGTVEFDPTISSLEGLRELSDHFARTSRKLNLKPIFPGEGFKPCPSSDGELRSNGRPRRWLSVSKLSKLKRGVIPIIYAKIGELN